MAKFRFYTLAAICLVLIFLQPCFAQQEYELPIVMDAYSHIGDSYSYASIGPNSFDCSGFIYYLFLTHYNIELPHSAYKIGYSDDYTKIIDKNNLQTGDVVCFNTNRGDGDESDHVGLYITNGFFIHASSGKGKVIISSLFEGFYSERFSWGIRIIEKEDAHEYNDKARRTR